jgi:hypothetical protein
MRSISQKKFDPKIPLSSRKEPKKPIVFYVKKDDIKEYQK